MEELINALISAIKKSLALDSVLMPQKARTSTEHIELLFVDLTDNGDGGEETLTLSATYRTEGTHEHWLAKTIKAKRALKKLDGGYISVAYKSNTLRAYWKRSEAAHWEYPDGDISAMPAAYVAPYLVTIDYPARLIEEA